METFQAQTRRNHILWIILPLTSPILGHRFGVLQGFFTLIEPRRRVLDLVYFFLPSTFQHHLCR